MNETRVKLRPAKWERVAVFACFAGSILSLALGFAFTTDWILSAARHPFLHAAGFTLLIIGIPILILGGHCLDLMEKKNTKSRGELHTQRDGSPRTLPVGKASRSRAGTTQSCEHIPGGTKDVAVELKRFIIGRALRTEQAS